MRTVSRGRRRALLMMGPLTCLGALVVVAFVLGRRDAVEVALMVLGASFAVALVLLGWMRFERVREERDA